MRTRIPVCFLAVFLAACTDEPPTQPEVTPYDSTLFDFVVANCLIVQAAAESSYVDLGRYAHFYELDGYLANGKLLVNPMTGAATDPVFFEPDGVGSTSYRGVYDLDENYVTHIVGYVITGRSETRDTTITNAPDSLIQLDLQVVENCQIVQAAAEAFADDNNSVYATDNGTAVNGMTIQDYPPDGNLLINPYTRAATEPTWGAAATAGASGYIAIDPNGDGVFDGYVIDGIGGDGHSVIHFRHAKNNTVFYNAALVRNAVENWYDEASSYPPILLSETPSGKQWSASCPTVSFCSIRFSERCRSRRMVSRQHREMSAMFRIHPTVT